MLSKLVAGPRAGRRLWPTNSICRTGAKLRRGCGGARRLSHNISICELRKPSLPESADYGALEGWKSLNFLPPRPCYGSAKFEPRIKSAILPGLRGVCPRRSRIARASLAGALRGGGGGASGGAPVMLCGGGVSHRMRSELVYCIHHGKTDLDFGWKKPKLDQ